MPTPTPSASLDLPGIIGNGMSDMVSQATGIVGAVAPGAIAIVGMVLAVRLGINIFRSLVGR